MIDEYNKEKRYNLFFILTTNYTDKINIAIKRSGRIENHFKLQLPTQEIKKNFKLV